MQPCSRLEVTKLIIMWSVCVLGFSHCGYTDYNYDRLLSVAVIRYFI